MTRIYGFATSLALIAVGVLSVNSSPLHAAQPTADDAPIALVTGANRGLGLELARQLQDKGYFVIGTARKPEKADELRALGARVEQLDVTDSDSVKALAERLGDTHIDLLVNNAGIFPRNNSIETFDFEGAAKAFDVNSLGPMRVTQGLIPQLRRGKGKTIVQVSSLMGSIEANTRGTSYEYRASKTALNSFNKTLSIELGPEGFTCVVVHPGWVKTDMGGPNAHLAPEESIRGLVGIIGDLSTEDNGRFFNYDGEPIAW